MENKSTLVDAGVMGIGMLIFFSGLLTGGIIVMQVGGSLTGFAYTKLFVMGAIQAARRRRQTK